MKQTNEQAQQSVLDRAAAGAARITYAGREGVIAVDCISGDIVSCGHATAESIGYTIVASGVCFDRDR